MNKEPIFTSHDDTGASEHQSRAVAGKRNLHAGHRDRMKIRFLKSNGSDLEDHELLEVLLYYVHSRVDTNRIAHELMDEFGSLRAVCNAPPDRLMSIEGVGEKTVIFLSLLSELRRRIRMESFSTKSFCADSLSAVGEYLISYYNGMQNEQLCAMLLDGSLGLIEFRAISNGSVNASSFDVRAFVRYAVCRDANYVILAHNHPSGICVPSSADLEVTSLAETALSAVKIELIEHIIVGSCSFVPTMQIRSNGLRFSAPGNKKDADMLKHFYNH